MTGGTNYRWVTVLAAALMAGAIMAAATRYFGFTDGLAIWGSTLAVAVLAGAAIALVTREQTDDGKHVRDDTLPR